MLVQNEVPVEALLKGSAAKVLLHLLAHRGEELSTAEIMRGSGVNDRNTFFAAKKQLKEYGLWENPYAFFESVGGNTHTVGGIIPTVGETPTTVPLMESGKPLLPRITARMDAEVVRSVPLVGAPEPENWRARLAEVDRLPGVGALDKAHDPDFRARRDAQVRELQACWRALFEADLTVMGAKGLLQLAADYAEDVFDKMEEVQARGNIQSPLTYIRRILESERAKSPTSPSLTVGADAQRGVQTVQTGLTVRPAEHDEREQDTFYRPPDERTQRILDRLRAAGKLTPEEDD